MSVKIEGSNVQSPSCDAELQSCQAQAAAPVQQSACVDTVAPLREQERTYAGERGLVEQGVYGALKQVPQPGAATLDVEVKVAESVGLRLQVSAEREEAGDYRVRVAARGLLGEPLPAHVEARLEGVATMRFHTPEAAADYLATLATTACSPTAALVDGDSVSRLKHYASNNLARVELNGEVALHLSAPIPTTYGAVGAAQRMTAAVDFERGALIMEQAVNGELVGRSSVIASRVGAQGELSLKARSEVSLPPQQLQALAEGKLSVSDALAGVDHHWKLILEGESKEETGTMFTGAPASQQKFELEFEPKALLEEDPAKVALHGERTLMWTKDKAYSTGIDLHVANVLVRGAIYDVSKGPIFGHHDATALQAELDGRRALTH